MRLPLLICLVLGAAVLCAAQEVSRRERLRSLISAARGGDPKARKALHELRTHLQTLRSDGSRRPRPKPQTLEPESVPAEVTTFHPKEPQFAFQEPKVIEHEPIVEEQAAAAEIEPEVVIQETPEPPRRERIQSQIPRRGPVFQEELLEPHRALNRGLEIDDRSEKNAVIRVTNRTKTPPIETIRRYSYFDELGNYIFGYEAADGSFREEKRGRDCIVHGKYGYIDPDGIKREYTYISGNQCNPDAPRGQEFEDQQEPLPRNNQFLIQTQEQRLDEAALQALQVNRRRKPVQQEQQLPEIRSFQRPSQQQQTVPRRRFKPIEDEAPILPQTTESTTTLPLPPPTTPKFIQITETRAPVVFRPTPKPLQPSEFNFDTEFKNLFNFATTNHFTPAQHRRPAPRPVPQPSPTPAPTPAPVKPKPLPKPRAEEPAPPKKQPHQLVFDSATGTFKTVPLSFDSFPQRHPPPPPPSFPQPPPPPSFSQPPSVGRPLIPSSVFSPLPTVPIGSLTFQQSSPKEFNNFLNHFRIQQ